MRSEATYEFWEHDQSGGVYAIRLNARGGVTGYRGPLFSQQIVGANPGALEYSSDSAGIGRIELHRSDWYPSDLTSPPRYF